MIPILLCMFIAPQVEERHHAELVVVEKRLQHKGDPKWIYQFFKRDPDTRKLVSCLWSWKHVPIHPCDIGYECRWSEWSWLEQKHKHYYVRVMRVERRTLQPPALPKQDPLVGNGSVETFSVANSYVRWDDPVKEMGEALSATAECMLNRCKPKVYIAGPMRGLPNYNFRQFDQARDYLKANGYNPISPADMDRELGFNETKDQFKEEDLVPAVTRDIKALLQCDYIALLPGWENSRGAKAELAVAKWLGLEVISAVNLDPLEVDVFGWSNEVQWDESGNKSPSEEEDICEEAYRITSKDRNVQYGPPEADFRRTAKMWSALFDREFLPHEVAMAMQALKLSRNTWNPQKKDNWLDGIGYGRCGWLCVRSEIDQGELSND